MKTAEERDAMVKRVQAAFKKWPSFDQLPTTIRPAANISSTVKDSGQPAYVLALYAVAAQGDVLGRRGQDVVGRRL